MHPVSQGMQEYEEMQSIYRNIPDMVGASNVGRI